MRPVSSLTVQPHSSVVTSAMAITHVRDLAREEDRTVAATTMLVHRSWIFLLVCLDHLLLYDGPGAQVR